MDLSAAYSTLSGVGLSLADYAITLTLTQLPDVARVRITVAGRELDYRSRQVFLARDILTVPKEDVVGTVDASLYFVNGDGALTAEARTLNLYEGDTQVSAVVRALENGPETKGLSAVLPEGFKVRKVWLEEEICYVSLSSALLEGQPERFWRWNSPCCRWRAWRKCGSWWTASWQTPTVLLTCRKIEERKTSRPAHCRTARF